MEPQYKLEKDSICYGCQSYRHWAESNDPEAFQEDDKDEFGGVCDTSIPCVCGSLNTYN